MLPERFRPQAAVAFASACAAVGLLTIYDSVQALIGIWRTDALKSIGMVVPIVCFALILRAWRSIGWETEGSWWGFAVLAISSVLMFLRDQMLLIVTVNKDWLLQLPPLPLVAVIYATGIVLLFGGRRLLRAAWFPVLLMWAVIPVPQTFSRYVDLPLQHIGATVARGFAHLIGAKLSTQDLNILFTPKFGMFIAPGCDGLRGSITLGLAAIVVGYVYRFRWFIYAPLVAGAVLLGYVFNLLRLCSLVIYDRMAVTFPTLQAHEQLADHIVGGCLFLLAAFLFFTMIEKLRRTPEDVNAAPAEDKPSLGPVAVPYLAKVMAILVLSAVFGLEALHTARVEAKSATNAATPPPMPQHIGNFSLVRTWSEGLIDGTVVYVWGEYETPDGTHVSLGISPELGVHDAEVCHIARGENPTWHGQIEVPSPQGALALTAATYNDGQVQKLEASTVCDGGICKQYSQTNQRFTVVYAKPHRTLPLQADTTRPVPVLMKVETSDTNSPVNEVEPKLAAGLQEFLKSADLVGLTVPYSKR